MTTLVACSHGTDSPVGRQSVEDLVALVRTHLAGTRVVQTFVDVQQPSIVEIVEREQAFDDVVVVPLLLSVGFHTAVDITQAVAPYDNVRQTEPLGTHPLIAEVLRSRLNEALEDVWQPDDRVVLAAAGSSNPAAISDVKAAARHLARLIPAPVTIGYASAAEPRIPEAVTTARSHGAGRVIAASHVLAPGYFAGIVQRSGADVVSAPLGVDVRIAEVIIDRFRSA